MGSVNSVESAGRVIFPALRNVEEKSHSNIYTEDTSLQNDDGSTVTTSVQEVVGLSISASSFLRHTVHSICESIRSIKNARPLESFKIVLLLSVPISIKSIGESVLSIKGSNNSEKVDAVLNIVSEVGTIADVIATSAEGFIPLGLATVKIAVWATPLFLVALGLEMAGLVLTTKNLIETHRFSKTFEKSADLTRKVEEYSVKHFASGVASIVEGTRKGRTFVTKHFGVASENLHARLEKIQKKATEVFASTDEVRKEKYRHKMKRTMELLDKRMTTMKWSRAATITLVVLAVIGVAVLMLTPAAPVGFAILGVAAALSITHYLTMRSLDGKFEREMKLVNIERGKA